MIDSPTRETKALSTLTARLALKGFQLNVSDDGPSGNAFCVVGPGGRRTFDSVAEVQGFLDRIEGTA